MCYPKGFPASGISAGWLIAPAKNCCHFAVFCFTSRCRQAVSYSRIGPLGSARSARVLCMSSSDFLLRRFSAWIRDWYLLMTLPDPLLNWTALAGIGLCSLEVCSEADNRSPTRCKDRPPMASQGRLSLLSCELLLTVHVLASPS